PRIPEASGGTIFILTAANGGDQPVTPRMVSGSVLVLEPEGPRPVGGLQCEQFLDRVKLSFTPTETYDRIDIFRGTSLIATLPGSETAFMEKIPGQGKLTYSVLARKGELKSLPAACVLIAVAPAAPVVNGLTCGDDGLSWTSPVVYDRLTVLRNGEHI